MVDANVSRPSVPRVDAATHARAIAAETASRYADDVDAEARIPAETLAAARSAGLLSAGLGSRERSCDIVLQSAVCFELARACASSGMILAMHYVQMDCLAEHAGGCEQIAAYLARLADEQRLIASATSEVGIDGDLRRSSAPVMAENGGFTLSKEATTISYGEYADDFLISARAGENAPASDQRLVLALGEQTTLSTRGEWDTLGMRGTVSPGGTISTRGDSWQVLSTPFAKIATISMVPLSHLLWAACWLGIGHDAVSRTRQAIQQKARRDPDSVRIAAQRLSAMHARLRQLTAEQQSLLENYQHLLDTSSEEELNSLAEVIRFNDLKVSVSEGVAQIVQDALIATGIAAYRNGTPFSLGRHLRDSLSAPLMISNDRIRASTAELQLVLKDR